MPSIKKSVMFSAETVEFIKARTRVEDEISWSAALNEGFKALKWLSNQSLPELTPTEWQYILNVYAGSIVTFDPPYRIASDMMDDVGAISMEELEPEYAELVKKVHSMSQAEQYAIMDFVQKFWAKDWSDKTDFPAIATEIKNS